MKRQGDFSAIKAKYHNITNGLLVVSNLFCLWPIKIKKYLIVPLIKSYSFSVYMSYEHSDCLIWRIFGDPKGRKYPVTEKEKI